MQHSSKMGEGFQGNSIFLKDVLYNSFKLFLTKFIGLTASSKVSVPVSLHGFYLYRLDKQYSPISAIASLYYLFDTIGIYTDWTNNIVHYRLSPHCTICLIPSAYTSESIRDKIYKILAYYINHIGITVSLKS
jgi:hypothetical protein